MGETYFLVAHLGKGAVGGGSDYDYLDLWINPSYDGSALATAHAEDIGNLISFSSFDLRSANLETGANGDVILLDELRLALTWDEALNYTYVPEPATMFLLAGGLLALARRRTSLKSRRR